MSGPCCAGYLFVEINLRPMSERDSETPSEGMGRISSKDGAAYIYIHVHT